MTPKAKQLLMAASPLLIFTATAFALSALLGLRGADAWILRGGLITLGGASSVVMYWFMRSLRSGGSGGGGSASSKASADERDVDATFVSARTQLASSRAGGKPDLRTLPALVVLGPAGSAKTTSIVRSGLDAELLGGGVMSGETIAPTTGVNVWFGRDALVIEAGGPMLADSTRWSRVLHHLRPSRLAALVSARGQPPRAVIVCLGCDRLMESGGAEASLATARLLRERLGELSRTLGTRLPVYAVFTKLDRVPFFADWVRGFTREEAHEVLGATLPGDLAAPTGSYADRETARLNHAFDHIFRSLACRRTEVLAREYALEHRGSAYEFPREFRKLAAPVVNFLVEMCRPSQLQVSPFLRGFYFTGVQAVLVSDAAPAAVQAAAPKAAAAQGYGATTVFKQPDRAALQPPTLTPTSGGVRKVPRWVFLDRLFSEVVLGDGPALDVTRGGAGADRVRRLGLAAAAGLGLVFTLGLIVSFIGNRRLESRTLAEARVVAALPPAQLDLPSVDQLGRLDALRARLQTLAAWDSDGAPLRLRFGLYGGSSLIAGASEVWFDAFERVMFNDARGTLLRHVRAYPDSARPTDDYGARYDLLKAYLVTTEHTDQSDPAFLTPVLLRHWLDGRELDPERNQLASRQFDHYGGMLPQVNPFPAPADGMAVRQARSYLLQFAGIEPIYRSMIADASSRHPAVQYNRLVPGSSSLVVNTYEVPGAFTREGWTAIHAALADIDRYYQSESWVLGEAPNLPSDRARLAADLRARYVAEYAARWREYLAAGSVARYSGLQDAARKLANASANQSPLLGMLAIAATHTAIDSSIASSFQPVHLVTPPDLTGNFLTDGNKAYVDALIKLQSSVQSAQGAGDVGAQTLVQASSDASAARVAARQLAQGFAGGDATVAASVLNLLEGPIDRVDPHLRMAGPEGINSQARPFCSIVTGLLGRAPFASGARAPEASIAEVTRFFRPGSGQLAQFRDNTLSRIVRREGGRWQPTGTASVNPAFLSFFESAMAFGDMLFRDGNTEPSLRFDVTPLTNDVTPLVSITIDGQSAVSGSNIVRQRMVWRGSADGAARLEATVGGSRTELLSMAGQWAVFRFFQAASSFAEDGNQYRVEWVFPGRGPGGGNLTVAAQVALDGAPVLRRDYFQGFRCPSEIVR